MLQESLVHLCCDLEKHVKGDIREDPRLLYRSKVKDLVARLHAKWQDVTQRCRSLQGKLHDYWEPLHESGDQSRGNSSPNESEQKLFTEVVPLQNDFRSAKYYMDPKGSEKALMQSNQLD
ncbi:SMC5-SMC6 complex localization factor protein 2-like [Protopterus annectens]|uniref:SMC5-SMC6 complex localization factor protein 2-like n=1 Tax=Protopterus annectens TaxID=7888 RepID=UPI001CFBD103|nr:SMC5-SMC6 complex localization factor protein 2-like [Protopterus annectens]